MRLFNDTILVYHSLTSIAPSASLLGLRSMVDFMTIHLDHWHRPHFYCHPDVACTVLTNLLAKRMPVAFTLFLENQYLGNHMFRETSVPVDSEYVAGIFAMQRGSDGAVDAAALRLHIDNLHKPHSLFTVCSILAIHGFENNDRASIFGDITTLGQLRPLDAAWDGCRRKHRVLAQSDGGEGFFSEQLVWPKFYVEPRPLQADEVRVEKTTSDIRYMFLMTFSKAERIL
ncbi:hypothetical protein EV421DRAFT_2032261 [Armillaria borealis]|uniref:Uncharacterized protein n=1 Tax=Armillaria borealis TaxID=47425 RepID=A0AA39JWB4_9AGAR|nr:hypothetical protein EV421DRAFT_2032261 [Armillaria borealis]